MARLPPHPAGPAAEYLAARWPGKCVCRACFAERDERVELAGLSFPIAGTVFVVCMTCGNKRCPHANDHHNACTGSNEPGQPGSAYP